MALSDQNSSGQAAKVAPTPTALPRFPADGRVRMKLEDIQALRQLGARQGIIVRAAPIGITLIDPEGRFVVANPAFQAMTGYSEKELCDLGYEAVTHPDDIGIGRQVVKRAVSGHRGTHTVDKRYIRKDGTSVWARVSLSALIDEDNHVQGLVAIQEDIGSRREIEQALRQSESRHLQMFERNTAMQLLIEPDTGKIVDANPAACHFYGCSRDDLRNTTIHAINVLSADIVAAEMTRAHREGRDYFVFRHRLWSGEERDVEVHSSTIHVDGRPLNYAIIHDITERIRVEAELTHQGLHDALTGLPNRILLHDRVEQAILRAKRDGLSIALLVLDLDQFREVNDTFGHEIGDLLLQEIGPRLQEVVRGYDSVARLVPPTVARLGGDEFAVVLSHTDEKGAAVVAERLIAALQQPIVIGDQRFVVSASLGIVLFPDHARDVGGLLRRADIAMHVAKRRESYVVYDADQDEHAPARHAIVGELREALSKNGLHLLFQPEVTCLSGQTVRIEALSRWLHPQRGLVPPDDFIPLAERAGLMRGLTAGVLKESVRECVEWRRTGREVSVAVNLSAACLSDPQLTDTIELTVRDAGADFGWLDLEITESAIMANVEQSMRVLQGLHGLGVRITVDDFGTGYSSLTYLRRLPVHAVKIDRSFVVEMALNNEDAVIVRSVVDLGHNLGLEVTAEGVEDREAYNMLVSMGCDVAQGHYFSHPLSADGIREWLANE